MSATATDIAVRMGVLAVSAMSGDVLVALGLGSCIGLALVDVRRPVAGLAHIMLPEPAAGAEPGDRYATHAVPRLLDEVLAAGARRADLRVILAGGADMFGGRVIAPGTEPVGARNERATLRALEALRLPVHAADTRGERGRTLRVDVATGRVTCKAVAGEPVELFAGSPTP